MRHRDKTVRKISTLLDRLSQDFDPSREKIWFRGHGVKTWKLVPFLLRKKYSKKEIDYIKEFKQHALSLVEQRPQNQYEWLFIMRHHYVPTRLLDWTESPLVAAYFAVSNKKHDNKDGAIWMLSPLELNRKIPELKKDKTLPAFEETRFLDEYDPEEFDRTGSQKKMKPVAFLAPRNTPRMHAQLSMFTINHNDDTPIEEIPGKHVWRYIIPKTAKKSLRKELERLQVTKFQLFPELENIQDKIKESR